MSKFCVYAGYQVDATGRTFTFGDGITAPSRRIYAITETAEQAEEALADMDDRRKDRGPRLPGNGKLYPVLEVGEFVPLEFVGRQERDNCHGSRRTALVRDLHSLAARNSHQLTA